MSRLNHTLRLGLKELTSLRHDSVLLLFLLYAFSVAIYMPAAGSVIGRGRVEGGYLQTRFAQHFQQRRHSHPARQGHRYHGAIGLRQDHVAPPDGRAVAPLQR